jgi:hypothetical protein
LGGRGAAAGSKVTQRSARGCSCSKQEGRNDREKREKEKKRELKLFRVFERKGEEGADTQNDFCLVLLCLRKERGDAQK